VVKLQNLAALPNAISADLKAKGMQVTELSPAESGRMRDKLTKVNAGIATQVGMDLWNETQTELAKIRAKK
jgi:TRAP-type transport system periplasmic protein